MIEATEIIGIALFIVCTLVAILVAFKILMEMKKGLQQRKIEHRWKQSRHALELLQTIKSDYKSNSALEMLVSSGKSFEIKKDTFQPVSIAEVEKALRIEDAKFNKKEVFIRECFNSLYDNLETVEHCISMEIIQFEDIRSPFEMYAEELNSEQYHYSFREAYGYDLADSFICRFDSDPG